MYFAIAPENSARGSSLRTMTYKQSTAGHVCLLAHSPIRSLTGLLARSLTRPCQELDHCCDGSPAHLQHAIFHTATKAQ